MKRRNIVLAVIVLIALILPFMTKIYTVYYIVGYLSGIVMVIKDMKNVHKKLMKFLGSEVNICSCPSKKKGNIKENDLPEINKKKK